MRVIPPFPIMSVAEWTCNINDDESSWSSGTTYTIGERVRFNTEVVDTSRWQYESLQNGNLNHSPTPSSTWWKPVAKQYLPYNISTTYSVGQIATGDIVAGVHENFQSLVNNNLGNSTTDTTKWLDIGPSNPVAAFELTRGTVTRADIPLVYTIRPQQSYNMNSIALLGLKATSVNIKISNFATPTVFFYNRTIDLTPVTKDWLAYGSWSTGLTGPLFQNGIVLFDLTPGTDVIITITITNSLSTPGTFQTKCGAIVLGEYVDLGGAEYGAVNDAINFSTVNRAFDGSTDLIVKRRNIPRNTYTTYVPSTSIKELYKLRNALNAEVAAWFGITDYTLNQFDALTVLGFYKRFSIVVDQQDRVRLDLEIEEV